MTDQVQKTVTIVRYANRKFYSKDLSKYVNLGDILAMPTGSFKVVSAVTQEDITDQTLLSALTGHLQDNLEVFKSLKDSMVDQVKASMASKVSE